MDHKEVFMGLRTIKKIACIVGLLFAATYVHAQGVVCLDENNVVITCPGPPPPVKTYWSIPTVLYAGVPFEITIYGGSSVQGPASFLVLGNGVALCDTGVESPPTPIWHCTTTISTPGTYALTTENGGGAYPFGVYVSQPPARSITISP
jgi:hypothetical protein